MFFRKKTDASKGDGLTFELFDKITIQVPKSFERKTRIINALQNGHYEASEVRALQAHLEPQDRLLDLGSGIGVVASLAAQTIPGGHVTCVEANAALLPIIRSNLDRNGAQDATLLHGAVCSDPAEDQIDFHIGPNFTAASLTVEGRKRFKTHRVPALRFSDVLAQSRPTFITCDIEGGEQNLLETPLPASVRFFCLEIHLSWLGERGIQQFFDRMHAQGFAYHPKGSAGGIVCFKRVPER